MADLVPDDELQPLPRRLYVPYFNPPIRPVATREPPPQAPDLPGDTLPMIGAAPPPRPPEEKTPYQEEYDRGQTLKSLLNPPPAHGWKKFGRVMSTIGQDVGTAVAPGIMENIPGTTANRRAELQTIRELEGPQWAREQAAKEGQARTGIEQERVDLERQRAGLPHMLPPGPGTYRTVGEEPQNLWEIPGQGTQWVKEGGYPKTAAAEPLPGAAGTIPGATLSGTRAMPAPPPPPVEGALPNTQQLQQAPMGAPAAAAPQQQKPVVRYGPPPVPLTEQERQQSNAELAAYYGRLNKGAQLPKEYQLPPGATKEDYERVSTQLKNLETAAGVEESRKFNQGMALDREQRAREEQARKQEEAGAKLVRAVDNDGKVHYMSRGDYDANARNFKPNPISLQQGALEKATDHNTVLNEMQGRLNAAAESARAFNFGDTGQLRLVMQAMADVERSYVDKVIGIPAMDFVAQNFKKWGLQGATGPTRQYIIDLISLREAMLGMPKEITGGSRAFEKAVDALYATLPAGVTPDLDYAMRQMRASQSIMDRLRGSRVPIIEGMHTIQKIPELYQYTARDPKRPGHELYSDDKKIWVDENGNPPR